MRVGCVECYTATEGCVCVFCWKTADLTCLNGLSAALDEWHSETWIRKTTVMDNWIIKLAAAAGLAWLFFSSEGQKIVNQIFDGISLETNIANYDCQAVADLVKGMELQNDYGRKYEILMVENLSQTLKTDEKIVCVGFVTTSGGEQIMSLSVKKAGDGEILYSVEQFAY